MAKRSLALAERSAGVSVNRWPPWRRSVAAHPRVRQGNGSTVAGRPTRMLFLDELGRMAAVSSAKEREAFTPTN